MRDSEPLYKNQVKYYKCQIVSIQIGHDILKTKSFVRNVFKSKQEKL